MTVASVRFLRRTIRKDRVSPQVRWVEPHGITTGQMQCITDYLAEVADHHWMTTILFWNVAVQREVLRRKGGESKSRFDFNTANGYGPRALRVREALREAKMSIEYPDLSYLPLGEVLDCRAHGLLSDELRWCVDCWQEDKKTSGRPYVRLLWITMPVSICPHHHTILSTRCEKCGSKQLVVSLIPRAWVCSACGNDLMSKSRSQRHIQTDHAEFWKAIACQRLIMRFSTADFVINPEAVALGVTRLAHQHTGGSVYKLGRLVNFERMLLHTWMQGKAKPSLPSLLEFCRRVEILPDELLSQQATFAQAINNRHMDRPSIMNRKILTEDVLATIRNYLKHLIAKNPRHPPSTTEVARFLHVTYVKLQYHFPRQYKILRQRYLLWVEKVAFDDAKRRVKKLKEGVVWLRKRHVYPSERHLKALTGVLPSDLRRSDIKRLLRRLQREMPDLVSSTNPLRRWDYIKYVRQRRSKMNRCKKS